MLKTLLFHSYFHSVFFYEYETELSSNIQIENDSIHGTSKPNYCEPRYAILKRGPRGGCFYINKNGNKSYVDRSCCD